MDENTVKVHDIAPKMKDPRLFLEDPRLGGQISTNLSPKEQEKLFELKRVNKFMD